MSWTATTKSNFASVTFIRSNSYAPRARLVPDSWVSSWGTVMRFFVLFHPNIAEQWHCVVFVGFWLRNMRGNLDLTWPQVRYFSKYHNYVIHHLTRLNEPNMMVECASVLSVGAIFLHSPRRFEGDITWPISTEKVYFWHEVRSVHCHSVWFYLGLGMWDRMIQHLLFLFMTHHRY